MKTINYSALPFTFLAAVMLGGCVGAEPIGGDDALDAPSDAQIEDPVESETIGEAESALGSGIVTVGAFVTFETYGDVLKVADTKADGYPAVGEIFWYGQCWNTSGNGTTRICDWDTPEITIKYRACRGVLSTKTLFGCSDWKYVDAGAPK